MWRNGRWTNTLPLRHTGMAVVRKKWRYGFKRPKNLRSAGMPYRPIPSHFEPCLYRSTAIFLHKMKVNRTALKRARYRIGACPNSLSIYVATCKVTLVFYGRWSQSQRCDDSARYRVSFCWWPEDPYNHQARFAVSERRYTSIPDSELSAQPASHAAASTCIGYSAGFGWIKLFALFPFDEWFVCKLQKGDNNNETLGVGRMADYALSMMQPTNILLRIATFSVNLDLCDNPLQLARRGLFYDGRRSLWCIFCGLKVPSFGEQPLDIHDQRSPWCSTDGEANHNAATILRATVSRLLYLNVDTRQSDLSFAELHIHVRRF